MSTYLYDNIEDFILSDSFRGDRYTPKERPYDQWLYIAAYHAYTFDEVKGHAKFKIGYTRRLTARNKELQQARGERPGYSASIVFMWPIPSAQIFETEVKRYFKHFIHEEAFDCIIPELRKVQAKDEIIWGLKLFTIVKLVRLIILKTCFVERFVKCTNEQFSKMETFMQPPDKINDIAANMNGHSYYVDASNLVRQAEQITTYKLMVATKGMFTEFDLQRNVLDEITFYEYIFRGGWRFIRTDEKFKEKPYDTVKTLLLNRNTKTFAKFTDGRAYPCLIVGYGRGPYEGGYFIYWFSFDDTFKPKNTFWPKDKEYFVAETDIVLGFNTDLQDFRLRL